MADVIVTVIRHGETDYNLKKIIQGQMDTPLNELGIQQAQFVGRYLRECGTSFDVAVSSDLQRARVTAENIMASQESPCALITDERLRERHLGSLQGCVWTPHSTRKHEDAEPLAALETRIASVWDEFCASSARQEGSKPKRVLLVSHGATMRQLVHLLLVSRAASYTATFQALPGEPEGVPNTHRNITNCSITEVHLTRQDGGAWKGEMKRLADDSFFRESRAPSPTANADIVDEDEE